MYGGGGVKIIQNVFWGIQTVLLYFIYPPPPHKLLLGPLQSNN